MCDITVIIPNYNGAGELGTCLDALEEQTYPADVIVVDDGSSDGSAHAAKERGTATGGIRSLTVLRHEENRGFAAAVNTGIRAAQTPYVLLLNNDTVPRKDMTEKLLRAIRRRKRAFAVQAALVQENGVIDSSGDYFCALGWAFSPGRDKPASLYGRPARIQSCCAAAALYDREVLEYLGLFDEAHFCYLEDVDVCLRAQRAGYHSYYEPGAVVVHKASASSGSRYNAFKARLTTANSLYCAYKNIPAPGLVCFAPLLFAGFAVKGVFYARKGLGHAFVQGLREGIGKIAAYRRTGEVLCTDNTARRDALLCMELLGNCVRRIAG